MKIIGHFGTKWLLCSVTWAKELGRVRTWLRETDRDGREVVIYGSVSVRVRYRSLYRCVHEQRVSEYKARKSSKISKLCRSLQR